MDKKAQFLIILAAVCWGSVGIFTRPLAAAGFSFAELSLMRSIIASTCLFVLLILTSREKIRISIRDIWMFVCTGILGIGLTSILYFNTIERLTLSAAAILLYTSPYMVMMMSALFFKERVTLQKLSALLIAFTGCVMTVGLIDRSIISSTGVLTGLSAAFCYSLYTIICKIALRKYDAFTVTAYGFGIAGLLLAPLCDFGKMTFLMGESAVNSLYILILGVLLTILPSVSYTKGLKELEPSRASILAFVEPLTSSVAGAAVYGEMLSPVKLLGMALIFISLVILNLNQGSSTKNPSVSKK